ncbi:Cleavage stimulation factor subunit 1-like protein [Zostera marina]|uniref:Cleavage stimulation factor 50 kDa subunit n=1 Tax=Zostera marina TaxID=29655 RepID=A0A0K9PQ69_ZOSMR|nr:Cleavage stimulation factor subunit 1-like protein [Zostera marina]
MGMTAGLEQLLETGKLHRQINALIVSHLLGSNLKQAAIAVASATLTPLSIDVPPNRLLQLVAKGLAVEKDAQSGSSRAVDSMNAGRGIQLPPTPYTNIDFSILQDPNRPSKVFPRHESRHVSEHKNIVRCAKFSHDGQFFATGSADTSIKLFEIAKVKQMFLSDTREGPIRPVIRTFYDNLQAINDLDFHPQGSILISGAKDNTIRFFDFGKTTARKSFKVIEDTHNVRSVVFHPSGRFVLAGTDHPIPHLYDVNTFQCCITANAQRLNVNSPINQVRYSASGSMYVTASKDGIVRIWDGVSAQCVRSFDGAHSSRESTSAVFTKNQRFVLSCGKDSTVKLWEVGTGRLVRQYLGASHTQSRYQAVFNETEEFVVSLDEHANDVVVWDSMTTERVARLPSNHVGTARWLEHSPSESIFISCGNDRSIRFWK